MKIIYILICFLTYNFILAQENPMFFVEIPNSSYILNVTHNSNEKRIAYSNTGNTSLDILVNTYKIYNVQHEFKNSNKSSLQNIYLVECDDIELMHDLLNQFSTYYPRVEDADRELLYEPNDYGTNGGYTVADQVELDFIRAPEAWDITKGSSDIKIGIADTQFMVDHDDLKSTLAVVVNNNNNPNGYDHGSAVSSIAAGDTNNGKGISAIGFDSYIYAANGFSNVVDDLSLFPEVKVINASFGSRSSHPPTITPDVYDEIINLRRVVVVAAAGNGAPNSSNPSSTDYYTPASYKDVISVTSIGHEDNTWSYGTTGPAWQSFYNSHNLLRDGVSRPHQYNDSVDIAAPGYYVSLAVRIGTNVTNGYMRSQGTSFASPIVAGTVALMFDVNYCIDPKEVETILKLTAVKIDHLPQNLPYYGKLGAGKLDAYEAVKMAKDMYDSFGTVEVKDRILYRPWFYKLVTAPYEIKMTNNDVTGGSKLKFRARNNIEILSGDYYPQSGGYIDLQIDNTIAADCPPPPTTTLRKSNSNEDIKNIKLSKYKIVPTVVDREIKILSEDNSLDNISAIKVYNFYGVEVIAKEYLKEVPLLDLNILNEGIYIVKLYNLKGENIHTQKIVKK
ncbi:S8 family serine peptidase [Psychroserpens sp. S379A]|uniref:S8 family serine peptidase n=1 Tax=Psychroserpens sp. S379A TaxID=3415137 RepID=UPI003C7B779A